MTVEERIAKLEQQNRMMKTAGFAAIALLAGVTLMGQASRPTASEEVRTRSLVVVDEAGGVRATLGATDSGARLLLYDDAGELRVDVDVTRLGPGLVLNDSGRNTRVALGAFEIGPRLWMFDQEGQPTWKAP